MNCFEDIEQKWLHKEIDWILTENEIRDKKISDKVFIKKDKDITRYLEVWISVKGKQYYSINIITMK